MNARRSIVPRLGSRADPPMISMSSRFRGSRHEGQETVGAIAR
jgi:hypothetical protein